MLLQMIFFQDQALELQLLQLRPDAYSYLWYTVFLDLYLMSKSMYYKPEKARARTF